MGFQEGSVKLQTETTLEIIIAVTEDPVEVSAGKSLENVEVKCAMALSLQQKILVSKLLYKTK